MKIKVNIHPIERGIRVVVGVFLMSMALWGPSSMWFLLGIIPAATGISGWCPLYSALGITTCKIGQSSLPTFPRP